jgi:hypothetical protein
VKILRNELDAERDVQMSGDGGFDRQRKHRNSMGGGFSRMMQKKMHKLPLPFGGDVPAVRLH